MRLKKKIKAVLLSVARTQVMTGCALIATCWLTGSVSSQQLKDTKPSTREEKQPFEFRLQIMIGISRRLTSRIGMTEGTFPALLISAPHSFFLLPASRERAQSVFCEASLIAPSAPIKYTSPTGG